MFLPKSKYKVKHASWGMFQLEGAPAGEFYVGPYIEDYLGRFYAGKDFETAQKRHLIPTAEPVSGSKQVAVDFSPSEEAYETGSYTRYFRRNRVSKVIEEITEDQLQDSGPYTTISGSWIVTGSLDDRMYGKFPYRGVRYRNQQTLLEWEKQMPGISSALELKPEDFVREIN